jgi:predicted lipoprotein with Yx(FWY)xxD motif/uncharacterized cupredoxin-like copper-binding protein
MKRVLWFFVPALLIMSLLAGNAVAQEGTPEGSPAAEEAAPTVFVRQHATLGSYLSDPQGLTLYLFTNDTVPGESACYDDCAQAWPPLTAEGPLALPGFVEGELGTIERTDGTSQVTYNGIPLYYFARDENPGDVNGQGVGERWYIVAPGQTEIAQASPVGVGMVPVGTPSAANEVTVTLTELTVVASQTEFKVGETYTFVVTNMGGFPHEFYIERAGDNGVPLEANGEEAEIGPFDPGQGGTLTWTFTEPGNYQLACHVRQHYPNGMSLNITVTA